MLIKCIKETNNFMVNDTLETFEDHSDNCGYHYSKGEKVDGNLIELYCNPCGENGLGITIASLVEDNYKKDDNTCWYLDDFFKEHFEIIG